MQRRASGRGDGGDDGPVAGERAIGEEALSEVDPRAVDAREIVEGRRRLDGVDREELDGVDGEACDGVVGCGAHGVSSGCRSQTMRKESFSVQRRSRVKVRQVVRPSPVGEAMVQEVQPSPPTPMPA